MSRAAAAACLVAVALLTAACAPEGASTAEAERWLAERQAEMPANALGSTDGRLGPDDPEPGPEDGVTLTFAEPEEVSEVRLECLGEGTVSFSVHVTTTDGTTTATETLGQTFPELPCDAGAHTSLAGSDVVSVRVNAFGADRHTAFHAVVLGAD